MFYQLEPSMKTTGVVMILDPVILDKHLLSDWGVSIILARELVVQVVILYLLGSSGAEMSN